MLKKERRKESEQSEDMKRGRARLRECLPLLAYNCTIVRQTNAGLEMNTDGCMDLVSMG